MNHKWNSSNICQHCGIEREKREHTVYGLPYSRLSRDGVWYDVTPETTRFEYSYKVGGQWQFYRPDCYEGWLMRVKKEQRHYPSFKGHDLNEEALKELFIEGKTPIDALNDLITLT